MRTTAAGTSDPSGAGGLSHPADPPLFPDPAGLRGDADAPLFPPLPPPHRPSRPAPDADGGRANRTAPRRIVHVPGGPQDPAGQPGPVPPAAGTPPPGRMPPPAPPADGGPPADPGSSASAPGPASAASTQRRRSAGGDLEGLVDGPVVLDTVSHRMLGLGVLVALGLLHLLLALIRLVASMGGDMPVTAVLKDFVYFLAIVAVMGLAMHLAFHGSPSGGGGGILSVLLSLVRGCFTLITTALRLLFTGLANAFRSGTRAAQSAGQGELQQAVRRFRIRDMAGNTTACSLVGDLLGPEVRQGDLIRVSRRGLRTGHIRIRRAEVLAAPGGPVSSVVTTRTARRFRLGVWADGLAWVLAAPLALSLVTQITAVFA
ncbi:hypothetical protein ACTVZO_37945 [Streptomyces sp. IBSNAI002]|uniref:hypothetical protein n=1 Tax=Streptomyces sp. IBSNAI002 TaxID=3457500 RepID=UPI003FD3454B